MKKPKRTERICCDRPMRNNADWKWHQERFHKTAFNPQPKELKTKDGQIVKVNPCFSI